MERNKERREALLKKIPYFWFKRRLFIAIQILRCRCDFSGVERTNDGQSFPTNLQIYSYDNRR